MSGTSHVVGFVPPFPGDHVTGERLCNILPDAMLRRLQMAVLPKLRCSARQGREVGSGPSKTVYAPQKTQVLE